MNKLTFRGSQYLRSPQGMPPVTLEMPGKFLGASSTVKRYTITSPTSGELVELQFLGHSYKRYIG